ncbi:polyhydroxyalkanoate synthesis repressor PhaR [Aureimonas populi]|uniref:Polyhydroxyalkanoate synthesis repressor PhaR n=1 Tax=Aureimonas populi TaxID=1701758 RepID=A0ABW5CNI2_9HYPH|nr:polyhydroxyalkanoate synthesis repressor PhaR [Aureimonas populi]
MAKNADTTIIKKYANRRLYNTGTSMYVTLENLASMVKGGEDFTVQDAKTGEDITHQVLTQIIFEQENKSGQTLMPATFLRQLIRFYGDQMQMVIPAYLEQSMAALSREQETFRDAGNPVAQTTRLIEEQVRRNTEMFRQAMGMFNPFLAAAAGGEAPPRREEPATGDAQADDLAAMRREIAEMRRKLDELALQKAQ